MKQLIDILHEGGYSCVIRNKGVTRTFHQRGVADLWALCHDNEEFLKNSQLADKVIGKGAAALMIHGGVSEVYADIISCPALELLRTNGISVSYAQQTNRIMNRRGDGLCPVESLCLNKETIEEMVEEIGNFIKQNI